MKRICFFFFWCMPCNFFCNAPRVFYFDEVGVLWKSFMFCRSSFALRWLLCLFRFLFLSASAEIGGSVLGLPTRAGVLGLCAFSFRMLSSFPSCMFTIVSSLLISSTASLCLWNSFVHWMLSSTAVGTCPIPLSLERKYWYLFKASGRLEISHLVWSSPALLLKLHLIAQWFFCRIFVPFCFAIKFGQC